MTPEETEIHVDEVTFPKYKALFNIKITLFNLSPVWDVVNNGMTENSLCPKAGLCSPGNK